MDDKKRQYRAAYGAWQEELQALHRTLLEGEWMEPLRMKGLLNREGGPGSAMPWRSVISSAFQKRRQKIGHD